MKPCDPQRPVIPPTVATATTKDYGITDVKAEHITFDWTIKHFSLLPQVKKAYLSSPIFHTEKKDVQFTLRLYPRGDKTKDYVSLYLFLYAHKEPVIRRRVYFDLSIIKSDTVKLKRAYDYTYKEIIGYGNRKFIKRSDLLEISSPDDTFTIKVAVDLMNTTTRPLFLTAPLEQELLRESEKLRWSENFSHLLKNPEMSDVVVLVESQKFLAHEKILATRSPVFAAMFQSQELKEIRTREVKIEGMEPIVVKAMLEFIYTDDVVHLDKLAFALLEAADIFKLRRLKIMCEVVLFRMLNEENAADILVLTDYYRCDKLKEHVIRYIADHHLDVRRTRGFRKLQGTSSNLSKELMRAVISRNSGIGFADVECQASSHRYRTTLMVSPTVNQH